MEPSYMSVRQLRQALQSFIEPKLIHRNYLAETLTFRPHRGRGIGKNAAIDTFKEHIKRVHRKTLGRKYTKLGQHLQVIPVLEGGEGDFDKHVHIHALVQVPDTHTSPEFAEVAARSWRSLALASRHQNRHESCTDAAGWLDYLLKFSDKPRYADSLIVDCLYL
jgi:hypothetical protein